MPSGAKPEAEAAPEAVAAEGPASGGPEVDDLVVNGPLTYALEYLSGSDVVYYKAVSEAICQQHADKYGCNPLVVPQVYVEKGSYAWWVHARGWIPASGEPVKIVDLFVGGLNDPPP